ncbi:MAG TPA: LCP family protein [Candidatus Limnocylindria bacterium]|jgi:LCP family protein required for cell wall assembly
MPPRPPRARLLTLALTAVVAGCALFNPSPTPGPTAEPTPTPVPTPRATPGFSPTPLPTPSPTPLNADLLGRRITVLFAGSDSTPDRVANGFGALTDSMIVASISADRTQLSMVALPRDVVDIPLGNGVNYNLKANSIQFNYGIEGLEGALEATYGIPIDYWIEIDMPDFPKIVDAVDGVWINNPYPISDSQVGLSINAGWQRIDGATALQYVRSRYTDSDYARSDRQMQLLAALASRIYLMGQKFDIEAMLTLLTTLRTNAPLTDLPTLLQVVGQAANAQVTQTVLAPPRFSLYTGIAPGRGYVQVANVGEMRAYVQSLMGN